MRSHEDDPFYNLGFTMPEVAEEFRAQRLESQKIDQVTDEIRRKSSRRPRRVSRVRDFEGDRDHADEMAALPEGFQDEPYDGEPIENPRLVAHMLARRAFTRSMAERLGGEDTPQYRIWLANYNEKHPLPEINQHMGA